jgi:hypothetical protein
MKKRLFILIATALAAWVLAGCAFFIGPEEPLGGGNLVMSFGEGPGRGITSAADLPQSALEALRYRVSLTGPAVVPEQNAGHGEILELAVPLGDWQLEVRAYKDDGLAGTATFSITVKPGLNVIDIPMKLNQGYFSITLDPDIKGGRVRVNADAAFPEATIRLTLTPDQGYDLKPGSLTVNNGAVPVEGRGLNYSFAMPAEDVTIGAAFDMFYAVEDPQEEAITVVAEHSVGGPVPDGAPLRISSSGRETLTFRVDGFNVEAGTLRWMMNGAALPSTGGSLVIRAEDYSARAYTLTVLTLKDDQWYSQDISFTVVGSVAGTRYEEA